MRRPTRRTRRFARRKGKGKGRRGKGKSKFSYFEDMTDHEYTEAFYGGKGRKGKGKRRSFNKGKGKGRNRNPVGSDGNVMLCSICGSDSHFRAACPNITAMLTVEPPSLYVQGPLGDLLGASSTTSHHHVQMFPTFEGGQDPIQAHDPWRRWSPSQTPTASPALMNPTAEQALYHPATPPSASSWSQVSFPDRPGGSVLHRPGTATSDVVTGSMGSVQGMQQPVALGQSWEQQWARLWSGDTTP